MGTVEGRRVKVLDDIEKLVQHNGELSLLLKQFQIGDEKILCQSSML